MNKRKQELNANGVICNADGHEETFSSVLNLNMTPMPFFKKKKKEERKRKTFFHISFRFCVVIVGGWAVSTAQCVRLCSVNGRKY